MRKPEDYNYDVFLSWTGADRPVKNRVKEILIDSGIPEDRIYDSDVRCRGEFRSNFSEALKSSMVYLLILTDNLRKVVMDAKEDIPVDDQKIYYSEVRREVSIAADLDAVGELNVVILNFSEFFAYKSPHMDSSDKIGEFFYNYTRGYNMINVYENLADDTDEKAKFVNDVHEFISNRRVGKPTPSSRYNSDVQDNCYESVNIIGRENEIAEIDEAFASGSKMVVLSGMGGMGKTTIARKYLEKCREEKKFVCPQIVRIELREGRERNLYDSFIDAVAYKPEFRNLSEKEKHEKKKEIVQNLPDYYLLLVDNINDITDDELKIFLKRVKCRLLITVRRAVYDEIDDIRFISVGKLPIGKATEMIRKESDVSTLTQSEVKPIYDEVDGHTLFLFLAARAMKTHRIALSQLYSEFAEKGTIDEEVRIVAGDTTQIRDKVGALMERLFDFDKFGNDKVKSAVLANLSVMLDGKLPLKYVKEALELDNINEIIELDQTGWIEYSRGAQSASSSEDVLSIHKMLANVVNNKLTPKQSDLQAAIKYLVCSSAEYRQGTLAGVSQLSDKLYHALTTIAHNEHNLCEELWREYEQLSNISDQPDEINRDCARLCKLIAEESDKLKVDAHAAIATVQYVPADVVKKFDQIKAMVAKGEYKTAYKMTPILFEYLERGALPEDEIDECLSLIADKAIANDNEYLAYSVYINALSALKNWPKTKAKIDKFLKTTKKKNGVVQLIKMFKHIDVKALYGIITGRGITDSKGDFSLRKGLKAFNYNIFVPIYFVYKLSKLPEGDPMRIYYIASKMVAEVLFSKGELDVSLVLDAVKNSVQILREKGLPHGNIDLMLLLLGNLLENVPAIKLGGYTIDKVALPGVLTIEQSEEAMTNLRLSVYARQSDTAIYYINALLINAYRSYGTAYTVQFSEALTQCADMYLKLFKFPQALRLYFSAYLILKRIAAGSAKLANVCRNILELYPAVSSSDLKEMRVLGLDESRAVGEILTVECLEDIFESSKGYIARFSWEELDVYNHYAKALAHRRAFGQTKNCEDELIRALREVAENAKYYCKNSGTFALARYYACLIYVMATLNLSEKILDEVGNTAKQLAKYDKLRGKATGKLIYMQMECTKYFKTHDKAFFEFQRKTLEAAVRKHNKSVVSFGIYLSLTAVIEREFGIDSAEKMADAIRCKPKNRPVIVKLVGDSVKKIGDLLPEGSNDGNELNVWAEMVQRKLSWLIVMLDLRKIRSADKLWIALLEKAYAHLK